ncbi:MAG: hypothetical protein WCV90_06910 [Candidatus Woesearchaeota archaeon]|jgi:hypothetical protein
MGDGLKSGEYFLWKKNTEATYPWLRQFTNQEFYKHERKRIELVGTWYNRFIRSSQSQHQDEISFYVVPVELSSSIKAAIASEGNFNFIGLSAIQNSPQFLILGMFGTHLKRPDDYSLIRIIKSKRTNVFDRKTKKVHPMLFLEEWEQLESDSVYLDIPYEKKITQKLISENLNHDGQMALSLSSPINSAPFGGSVGGIAVATTATSSTFAQELIKTIQLMVPPQYRGFNPPPVSYQGSSFEIDEGITFKIAERPFSGSNFLSGVWGSQYNIINDEVNKRKRFAGEYSIFSTINQSSGTTSDIWNDLLKNFSNTEITIPQEIDEMPDSDIDLTNLRRVINEDLWIQIVNLRQIKPSFNEEMECHLQNTLNRLKIDLDAHLSSSNKDDVQRKMLIDSMMVKIGPNIRRIAQSIARANDKSNLSPEDLDKARSLTIDNFSGFLGSREFKWTKAKMEGNKQNSRVSVIQTLLINNSKLTCKEIFEELSSTRLYKDIFDLQQLLDWLHEKGQVVVDQDKKYIWLGNG